MNTSNSAIWIFTLANSVVALAGLFLGNFFESIFEFSLEGGRDVFPPLTKIYMSYQIWIFVVFAVPLAFAARILTLRGSISFGAALVFGAVSVLIISFQILVAIVAIVPPYLPVAVRFKG